jgi:hypothetical protein
MLKQYLLSIGVLLDAPYIGRDKAGKQDILEGFFQNVGVTASNISRARTLVEASMDEGRINWTNSTEAEIDLATFDEEISRHCKEPHLEGVWYLGPKFLYEADKGQA